MTTPTAPGPDPIDRRINRALARARRALLLERIWPPLMAMAGVVALFVAVSWLGLWLIVPDWARLILLTLFGIALLVPLVPIARTRLPGAAEALARVEQETGGAHHPVTGYRDSLASGRADPVARALWAVHRQRLAEGLDRVVAGLPKPEIWRRDPYALRTLVGLLLVIGFGVASGDHLQRLKSAFRGAAVTPGPGLRIDAWVTPPAYTGRTPIFLTGDLSAGNTSGSGQPLHQVPEGSEVIVRVQGRAVPVAIRRDGDDFEPVPDRPVPGEIRPPGGGAAIPAREYRTALDRGATVALGDPRDPLALWHFSVDPDRAPQIRFLDTPKATSAGALELTYAIDDDYGAVSGAAEITQPKPVSGVLPRPLIPAPEVPLSLPAGRGPRPDGERTTRDLTAHPWAGAPVAITLVVKDQAGQEGRSATVETTLPARRFMKPVARALVEQRRDLAMDADAQIRVLTALDAIQLAMEGMDGSAGGYLGVHDVYRRLAAARTDAELTPLVDALWDLALMIEDGDLSEAARALRDAQEALRRALENGAPPEEIARLTETLREAMNRYLQEMMQQAARNPDGPQPMDPATRMLTQNDLDAMLKRIEELARSGSREAAQEMLSQLQRMLENLQAGRSQQSPGQSEMSKALDDLGRMIQQQQKLMDDTFRADRQRQNGQRPGGESSQPGASGQDQPMTPDEMAEALRQLQEGQGDLARKLQQLLKRLEQAGADPGSELGEAGDAMGQAGEALGRGQPGDAVGAQGQALDRLRKGAEQLAREQNGEGEAGDGPGQPGASRATDPLGRPQNADNTDNTTVRGVPDEFDLQRARRVFEELRKRLGEQERPRQERDYLERLLPND